MPLAVGMAHHSDAACALLAERTFTAKAMAVNDMMDPNSASTLLHYAAEHNMAQMTTALLMHDADVCAKV